MSREIIECPHCGRGTINRTTKGAVTQNAAQIGGQVAQFATKEIANSVIFDGAGRYVPKFGDQLASLVSVEHVCDNCDCLFMAKFFKDGILKELSIKKFPMPNEIIEKVREEYIQSLKDDKPIISSIIFLLLTLYFFVYMFMGVADDNGFQVAFNFLLMIPCLILSILKGRKIASLNEEIGECESQLPLDFKRSHRELFSQYKQYN